MPEPRKRRANVRAAIDELERQVCQCFDSRGEFAAESGRKVKVQCVRCSVLVKLGVDDPHLVKP